MPVVGTSGGYRGLMSVVDASDGCQ